MENLNTIVGYGNAEYLDGGTNVIMGSYIGNSSSFESDGSVLIGYEAGKCLTTSDGSVHVGYKAGAGVTEGNCDVIIGYEAACANCYNTYNCTNSCNVYIGRSAAKKVAYGAEGNVFIGAYAGICATVKCGVAIGCGALSSKGCLYQDHLVAIGNGALNQAQGLTRSVAIGDGAGRSSTSGSSNFFGGYNAGRNNTTGMYNTFIGGNRAGCYNSSGSYNVYLGSYAGRCGQTNCCNVFVGKLCRILWHWRV